MYKIIIAFTSLIIAIGTGTLFIYFAISAGNSSGSSVYIYGVISCIFFCVTLCTCILSSIWFKYSMDKPVVIPMQQPMNNISYSYSYSYYSESDV